MEEQDHIFGDRNNPRLEYALGKAILATSQVEIDAVKTIVLIMDLTHDDQVIADTINGQRIMIPRSYCICRIFRNVFFRSMMALQFRVLRDLSMVGYRHLALNNIHLTELRSHSLH